MKREDAQALRKLQQTFRELGQETQKLGRTVFRLWVTLAGSLMRREARRKLASGRKRTPRDKVLAAVSKYRQENPHAALKDVKEWAAEDLGVTVRTIERALSSDKS